MTQKYTQTCRRMGIIKLLNLILYDSWLGIIKQALVFNQLEYNYIEDSEQSAMFVFLKMSILQVMIWVNGTLALIAIDSASQQVPNRHTTPGTDLLYSTKHTVKNLIVGLWSPVNPEMNKHPPPKSTSNPCQSCLMCTNNAMVSPNYCYLEEESLSAAVG